MRRAGDAELAVSRQLDVFQEMAMVGGVIGLTQRTPWINILWRALALGSAALVFALGVFAVSPALHKTLHPHDDLSTQDQCAVAMFANGVSVPFAFVASPPPVADWAAQVGASSIEVLLDSPRYLLQPERGPPLA